MTDEPLTPALSPPPRKGEGEAPLDDESARRVLVSKDLSAGVKWSREWAMPSADTFDIPHIAGFVKKHLMQCKVSIDPFARNKRWATYTNDLNPATAAEYHMDAVAFMEMLVREGVKADLIIIDPPYSPRQISECYQSAGLKAGMKDTQSAVLYQRVKNAAAKLATKDAIVLSFGWNSVGLGKDRGFEISEIMLVCHGGAHNDTICMSETKRTENQTQLWQHER